MFRDEDCAHTGKPSICDNHYYASNYQTDGEVKGVLTFKNGTLYTDAAQTEGFSVSPTVKVILAQSSATYSPTIPPATPVWSVPCAPWSWMTTISSPAT